MSSRDGPPRRKPPEGGSGRRRRPATACSENDGASAGSAFDNLPFALFLRLRLTLQISRLQLALQFIEEAPVGAPRDDSRRTRLDELDLVQPQCIEAKRVLRIVFAPFVVAVVPQGLQRILVTRRKAAIDELLRDARRVADAQIGRLQ